MSNQQNNYSNDNFFHVHSAFIFEYTACDVENS